VAWIRKLKGRCPVVHLKDFAIAADRTQFFTEIGNGNLDWPGILAACEESGTEFMPVEQDRCPGDPFESLRISYENLKAWGYR
jgi:sugar phosphate isomerase/epimerase